MASAMADKKWSDLGVALRFLESDKYDLLFKGWVVDAFIKQKKQIKKIPMKSIFILLKLSYLSISC